MTDETIQQVLPTTTGFAAKQAIAVLRKHEVAIAPLLRRAGLSEHDLARRPIRISAAAQSKLLEFAAEAMNDNAFGLHLAQQSNPREVGLVFYVASAAKTVNEALVLFARYCRIANEALRPKLIRSPGVWSFRLTLSAFPDISPDKMRNSGPPLQSRVSGRWRAATFTRPRSSLRTRAIRT